MSTKLRLPPALFKVQYFCYSAHHSTPFSIFCENSAKILLKISPAAGTEAKTTGGRNTRKWKKLKLKVFTFSGKDSELKGTQA
jgi:hypothetical protein